MTSKRIFISADHGLAVVYFLQTDVLQTLLDAGLEVVVLTDDALTEKIGQQFARPGLTVTGLRLDRARAYFESDHYRSQYWLHFLRWMGGSNRVNLNPQISHMRQMSYETSHGGKLVLPAIKLAAEVMRRSPAARRMQQRAQNRYVSDIYADLFDRYQPDLVVASTPGWRLDRYLLREAAQRGVRTAAAVIGWDNPSSYRLPGAPMDAMTCWSQTQKDELVDGSDWNADVVNIGGIPTYDGYFRKQWQMPREEYFALHGLDPQRKLLAYASSFVTFAPNYPNIAALAELVSSDQLAEPSQLLIRLHPNHFMAGSLYEQEANQVRELVRSHPHVHLVEPVPLGGELGYYSGEDMPEKASMMAHADVFLTVYSTMVVETAIHNRPIVAVCIDTPGGWNTPGKFSLPLAEISEWPTHQRFRDAGAGKVAFNIGQVREAVNAYLRDPALDSAARQRFVEQEVTFTDGSAGERTGAFLAKLALGQ